MNVYISGPISGTDYWDARDRFYKVWSEAREAGCEVVDPTDIGAWGLSWETYMRIATTVIESGEIDLMVMLNGWTESKGACIEWLWANKQGIRIAYQAESGKYRLEGNHEQDIRANGEL